ncbi:MAG: DinB family protein, partial [Bacteroidota bacterium]
HHCADSHMNAYLRFKLALTEDQPTIKPYDEAAWATLPDSRGPIGPSLSILDGLHARWVELLTALNSTERARVFLHPEHDSAFTLTLGIDNYQWHCRHHLAHVYQALRLQLDQ